MVGTLNLYLDTKLLYTWRQASVLTAKVAGRSINHAHNLQIWIHQFLHSGKLPLHHYGTFHLSILEDEDFSNKLQLHLTEIAKKGYIQAQDIVDYIATPEVQEYLGTKAHDISEQTV
jgi:hypothetical protein